MKNFLLALTVTTIIGFILGMVFFNLPQITQAQIVTTNNLETSLTKENLGSPWLNPIKYVIKGAINSGISATTIALLLLLTVVTAFIAGVRHLVGVHSFGIFLPAALSVVFVVIGPILGIGLFLLIIVVASLVSFGLITIMILL